MHPFLISSYLFCNDDTPSGSYRIWHFAQRKHLTIQLTSSVTCKVFSWLSKRLVYSATSVTVLHLLSPGAILRGLNIHLQTRKSRSNLFIEKYPQIKLPVSKMSNLPHFLVLITNFVMAPYLQRAPDPILQASPSLLKEALRHLCLGPPW